MKTYRIRLKPHCQRATDVERNYFTHATKGAGSEPLICALDLREPCSSQSLIDRTLDRFGRIDALLNIAGAVPQIDLFEMTDQQWEDGAALKLHASRRLTIRAWEALKAANGAVVFISGSAALDPKPGFAAVATINAAIIALAVAGDAGLFRKFLQSFLHGHSVRGCPFLHE